MELKKGDKLKDCKGTIETVVEIDSEGAVKLSERGWCFRSTIDGNFKHVKEEI